MAKLTREQAGVKAGDKIILKGKVAFARLDKAVTGEALARENERRAKHGMLPTKEFRSITIEDPEIVQGAGTPLATYYGQSVYTANGTGKPSMTIESKSLYPPQYGHMVNGTVQEIADPQRNPATGQVVYVMISAFAPKGFNNLGSSFDAIIFDEGPIQFYEGNNSLAGFGQAMNMKVTPLPAVAEQPIEQPLQQAVGFGAQPVTQTAQAQTGFGQNPAAVQNQPVYGTFGQAPVGDPNQPVQGGFGQAPINDPNQPEQGGFPPTNANPFGVQDADLAASGNPFGAGNSGNPGSNPFA